MRIDILTVEPELLRSPLSHSIVQRARDKGLIEIMLHNLRDFGLGNYRQVDDYPYGGGGGMVLMIEPIAKAIEKLQEDRTYDEVILFSPDGTLYNQQQANTLSTRNNILMLCGHYKGVDERIRQHFITMEISIGDYVLTGGELPAAVVCDSIARLLPGVLGDEASALSDSFQDKLISPPVYTRPADFNGWRVPDILRSGNDKAIENWRQEEALKRTKEKRPGLLDGWGDSKADN
ncbi:MAG: tRNA (guanosine(37)-N1)-methyltransferase TrmD [Flavobacteriales bacterium]